MRSAFSRDQAQKVYVTNLLREDTELVWQVIDNKGHVYICGYVSILFSSGHSTRAINSNLYFFYSFSVTLKIWLTMLGIFY